MNNTDTPTHDALLELVMLSILDWWETTQNITADKPNFVQWAEGHAAQLMKHYQRRCRQLTARVQALEAAAQTAPAPAADPTPKRGRKSQAEHDLEHLRQRVRILRADMQAYCTSEYTRLFDDENEKGYCIPARLLTVLEELAA